MKKTSNRVPYVLCHPGDSAGCGHHRLMRPLDLFQQNGVAFGRPEFNFLPSHLLKALNPDVVVWQRQSDPSQIEVMRRYREDLPNAFFVYEIDDAMSSVPDKSWHRPYMPPDIDVRTAEAANLCDAITVTTKDLATHMGGICGPHHPPVRIVPNMLSKHDFVVADAVRKAKRIERAKQPRTLFRIGWGGGIGHHGDLALLERAFVELKDRVEWVFLGMTPDLPAGTKSTFVGAATPQQYLAALASLDVDLVVAPLEENHFNLCKSNLRLIEAGACRYPVIATPIAPYLTNTPPVAAYAKTADEWVREIVKFMGKDAAQQGMIAERMRRWVEHNYTFEEKITERLAGWLPADSRPFRPKKNDEEGDLLVIVAAAHAPELEKRARVVRSLREALTTRRSHEAVLYIRDGVGITNSQLDRLLSLRDETVASVSVISNDGGPAGFPQVQHTGIDKSAAETLDAVCAEERYPPIAIPAAAGPVVLLGATALSFLGDPAFTEEEPEDLALIEWSASASLRGFRNVVAGTLYVMAPAPHTYPQEVATQVATRIGLRWKQGPMDEEGIATVRERLEIRFHRDHYKFIPPQDAGNYDEWTASVDTLDPLEIPPPPAGYAVVRYGDSVPAGTKWAVFIGPDTILVDHALPALENTIRENPGVVIVYADHDYLMADGSRSGHDFKPNIDTHLLVCRDYVTQVLAVNVGALIPEHTELTESGAYGLVLQEALADKRIAHTPRILGHVKLPHLEDNDAMMALSERYNSVAAQRIEIADRLVKRAGWNATVKQHAAGAGLAEVSYIPTQHPLVSIILPTKDRVDMLGPCLATVLAMTTYPNFEVVLVSNNTETQAMEDYLASITDPRVRVTRWNHPYNWSALNNYAIAELARGDVFCLLNDDTRVNSPHWLDEMVGALSAGTNVGAVGARLVYPSGQIQHIGVMVTGDLNGHYHKGAPSGYVGYNGIAAVSHEATAVTGACLVVSRSRFDEVGGLDETFAHNFNDVLFCLQLRKRGYVNVLAGRAELQHYEGITRTSPMTPEGYAILMGDFFRLKEHNDQPDPYWNPNLAVLQAHNHGMVMGLNFDVLNWSPAPWPWMDASAKRRILFVGSPEELLAEKRLGTSTYELSVVGFKATITSPPMNNLRPFDLRAPEPAAELLAGLDLSEIVITSLGDAPIQVLSFLTRLGVPITYRPVNVEAACPVTDLRPGGVYCNQGWRKRECQACVDRHGSPHGHVSVMAWLSDWMRFLGHPNVDVDVSRIGKPEYALAIREILMGENADVVEAV